MICLLCPCLSAAVPFPWRDIHRSRAPRRPYRRCKSNKNYSLRYHGVTKFDLLTPPTCLSVALPPSAFACIYDMCVAAVLWKMSVFLKYLNIRVLSFASRDARQRVCERVRLRLRNEPFHPPERTLWEGQTNPFAKRLFPSCFARGFSAVSHRVFLCIYEGVTCC